MPLVRAFANKFIAGLLVVTSLSCVVLGVGLWLQRQSSADFSHCTAEWQDDFVQAYKARSSASIVVSRAMDRVVRAVSDQDPDAFDAAVTHYLAVRDRQNEERAKNPLPPLPSKRCGE